MKALPLALAVLAGVTYSSPAAFNIQNAQFEFPTDGNDPWHGAAGDSSVIDNWFDSIVGDYYTIWGAFWADYTTFRAGDTNAQNFSINRTRKLGLDWGQQGYVYQDIGAWSGEHTLSITCDSLCRDLFWDASRGQYRDRTYLGRADFSVWDMNPAAVGAIGTKPVDLGGVLLGSAFTIDCSTLTYTGDTATFTLTFDLSACYPGDHIWLMIDKNSTPGANSWNGTEFEVLFDNLAIIPEPSTVALLGLAAGTWVILRRRKT